MSRPNTEILSWSTELACFRRAAQDAVRGDATARLAAIWRRLVRAEADRSL